MADVPGILDYLRNRDFRFIPALFELHNPEELIAMTQRGCRAIALGIGTKSSDTSWPGVIRLGMKLWSSD